jgi:hypothetical protein
MRRPRAGVFGPFRRRLADGGSGAALWRVNARAGVNSFPAIDGDTLLVGAAAAGFFKKPVFELIAYRLS